MEILDPTSPLYRFEPKRNKPIDTANHPSKGQGVVKTQAMANDDLRALASQCSVMALETLAKFASDPETWKGLALAASKEILDRAHGKAVAPSVVQVVHTTLEELVMASYKAPAPQDIVIEAQKPEGERE